MIYPDNDVIMYAFTELQAYDELIQYGILSDEQRQRVVVVTVNSDPSVALALPVDTPWCAVAAVGSANRNKLLARFGEPQTVAAVLAIQTNETVGAYRGRPLKSGTN